MLTIFGALQERFLLGPGGHAAGGVSGGGNLGRSEFATGGMGGWEGSLPSADVLRLGGGEAGGGACAAQRSVVGGEDRGGVWSRREEHPVSTEAVDQRSGRGGRIGGWPGFDLRDALGRGRGSPFSTGGGEQVVDGAAVGSGRSLTGRIGAFSGRGVFGGEQQESSRNLGVSHSQQEAREGRFGGDGVDHFSSWARQPAVHHGGGQGGMPVVGASNFSGRGDAQSEKKGSGRVDAQSEKNAKQLSARLNFCSLFELVGFLGKMGEWNEIHLNKAITRMSELLRQSSQRMGDHHIRFVQALFSRAADIAGRFEPRILSGFLHSAGELGVVPAPSALSAIERRSRDLISSSADSMKINIIRTCSGWKGVRLSEAQDVINVLNEWKVVPSPNLMRGLLEDRGQQGEARGRRESPRREGPDGSRGGGGGVRGRNDSGRQRDDRGGGVKEREDSLGKGGTARITGLLKQCKTLPELVGLAAHVGSFSAYQVTWALRLIGELAPREQRVGEWYARFVSALVDRGGACMRDFDLRGVADFVYRTDKYAGVPPARVLGPLLAKAAEFAPQYFPAAAAVLLSTFKLWKVPSHDKAMLALQDRAGGACDAPGETRRQDAFGSRPRSGDDARFPKDGFWGSRLDERMESFRNEPGEGALGGYESGRAGFLERRSDAISMTDVSQGSERGDVRSSAASRSAELSGLISQCTTERGVCRLAGSVGEFSAPNVVAGTP